MDFDEPMLKLAAAKPIGEPKVANAALPTNVLSSEPRSKRDKTKVGFAKGLWDKNSQRA